MRGALKVSDGASECYALGKIGYKFNLLVIKYGDGVRSLCEKAYHNQSFMVILVKRFKIILGKVTSWLIRNVIKREGYKI